MKTLRPEAELSVGEKQACPRAPLPDPFLLFLGLFSYKHCLIFLWNFPLPILPFR